MEAFAELNDKGDRCLVHFRYTEAHVEAIRRVPGAKFIPRDRGGPHWQLPLDLMVMQALRREFREGLTLGQALKIWGREAVGKNKELRSLVALDDVPLKDLKLKKKLPKLAKWLRSYQRADIKFMATTSCLNLLEPRLGKTAEVIGAVFEADLENGPHLVVAPKTTLDEVWRMEIERWTDHPVVTYSGDLSTREKAEAEELVEYCLDNDVPFWFVTTADMVRRGSIPQVKMWNSFTIDEFHKTGLPEIKNVFPKAAGKIEAHRKWALSGTPMGGKPIKLWGGLHFVAPQIYTTKWGWAKQWLVIEQVWGDHRKIGGIRDGMEDDFYTAMAPFAIRRTREEELPHLPKTQWVDVWCEMTPKQAKQYNVFAEQAEIRIDEYHLSATSVLAEYTRLKQFANSMCEVEVLSIDPEDGHVEMKLKATEESGKVPSLLQKLAERGIDPEEPEGDEQAVVASQFRETAEMIYRYLDNAGIGVEIISGKVKQKDRNRIMQDFQAGKTRVAVLVTAAAGVGITLNRAADVHILDETWNPDDQTQVADRVVDTTKLHQVTAFTYRSRGTIEEDIALVNDEKFDANVNILDVRRKIHKQKQLEGAK